MTKQPPFGLLFGQAISISLYAYATCPPSCQACGIYQNHQISHLPSIENTKDFSLQLSASATKVIHYFLGYKFF